MDALEIVLLDAGASHLNVEFCLSSLGHLQLVGAHIVLKSLVVPSIIGDSLRQDLR